MIKVSRRKTRSYLLQALYARSMGGINFDEPSFLLAFFDEATPSFLDSSYFQAMFTGVIEKEGELLTIIHRYAPKFDITSMPVGNLLPIMIASYEMLYLTIDTIPEKVSINEAIELAKIFSDDTARTMVNGVLNALKNEKTTISEAIKKDTLKARFFV
ncbi:MAG: transcription antitermination protein NusB [Candidatus Gracilibacteria bacterium]|nr:transcription antitermination protein NusB [Candidatus Gracilibacteria bacterium]